MEASEIVKHRKRLEAALSALAEQEARGVAGQAVVTLDQQAMGRLSRMDALQNQAMAKAQGARRAAESRRIRAALTRMDDGEFGYCTDCGDALGAERLDADPAVPRCVSCTRG